MLFLIVTLGNMLENILGTLDTCCKVSENYSEHDGNLVKTLGKTTQCAYQLVFVSGKIFAKKVNN